MTMVFVPFTRAAAALLQREGSHGDSIVGHTATAELMRRLGYDQSAGEEADYAALSYAGVRAVLSGAMLSGGMLSGGEEPLRLVLAVEVPAAMVQEAPGDRYGAVSVQELGWAGVQALFSDEPEAAAAVALARQASAGRSLADALDLPEVDALLTEHDLLWFTPEELGTLP